MLVANIATITLAKAHLFAFWLLQQAADDSGNIGWDPNSLTLKFEIVAIPDVDTAPVVKPVVAAEPVSFRVVAAGEPKPDMFAPGRDVIVEGKLGHDGAIAATQVMTSCPSKYKPKQSQ